MPLYFTQQEAEQFEQWLDHFRTKDENSVDCYYVLEVNGLVVGCGGFGYLYTSKTATLAWGLVHRNHHKQGLGKQLFEFRISQIKTMFPEAEILLDTTQHSYSFFEKLGFKIEKITNDFYAKGLDRYDMKLSRAEGQKP